MEDKKYPYKLEFGVRVNGESKPLWVYDHIPDGMERVRHICELWPGRLFLSESRIHPGEYITDYMRDTITEAVKEMLLSGIPIYVKAPQTPSR